MTRIKKLGVPIGRSTIYSLVVVFFTSIALTVLAIQYADYVDRRSNQRWCGIVTMLDNTYKSSPPASETGKRLAIEMKNLRESFEC